MSVSPISLWDSSAEEKDYTNPFTSSDKVDVAIVGGGFTGLSTVLHCAEHGLSAHVLEAKKLGMVGRGAIVAWLMLLCGCHHRMFARDSG